MKTHRDQATTPTQRKQERERELIVARERARFAGRRVPRKLKKPPRARIPLGIERDYLRALQPFLDALFQLTIDNLFPILENVEFENKVLEPIIDHTDQAGQERVFENIGGMRLAFFTEFDDNALAGIAARFSESTQRFNDGEFKKQVKSVIGIELFQAEPFLEPTLQAWTAENIGLIKTVAERHFNDMERIAQRGFRLGTRHEDIAKEMRERFNISKTNAKRIARDQISKLNGQLARLRQTNAGVEEYIWRTVGDDRVRDEHEDLNGQKFRWDSPPSEGHPGEPINCRCTAEPVFEDLSPIFEDENAA